MIDMRVLGAVRLVDALLGTPITDPLAVVAPDGVRILRNRSGVYAIADATNLATYAASFVLPTPPPAGSATLVLTISDPSGRYLARSVSVDVPRDPDLANAAAPSSVFRPVDVAMFASPTARVREGAAALRLSVKRAGSDDGLAYAFVRVTRASDNTVLARGMTDARGEALIGVPGIPVTTWSSGPATPVTTSTVAAHLAACYAPTAAGGYPDPDQLDASFAALPHSADVNVDLASGSEIARRIDVALPP
jgi:hypothetical protein